MGIQSRRALVVVLVAVGLVSGATSAAGSTGTLAYVAVPGWQVPFTLGLFATTGIERSVTTVPAAGGPADRLFRPDTAQPAWSPGGDRIAYFRLSPRTGAQGLWTARADGSHRRRLIAPRQGAIGHPTWSPDGTTIAFERGVWRGDRLVMDLWTIGRNRRGLRRITRTRGAELMPSWGPDGRIAFVRADRVGGWNIHVLDPATGAESQLTAGPERELDPDWSSDGARIAFSRETADRIDIWTMSAAGTDLRRVTASGSEQAATDPAWSPDDTEIAYCGWGPYGNDHEILVIAAGGGAPRRLTFNRGDDLQPDWRAP